MAGRGAAGLGVTGGAEIVVVDDDAGIAETLRDTFEDEGYRVRTAHSAAAGRAALRERVPNLLVLDVSLPDGDGLALLQEIRADAALARLPVVVFTALGTPARTMEGFLSGANAYIPKPFDTRRLLAAVDRLLREAANGIHSHVGGSR